MKTTALKAILIGLKHVSTPEGWQIIDEAVAEIEKLYDPQPQTAPKREIFPNHSIDLPVKNPNIEIVYRPGDRLVFEIKDNSAAADLNNVGECLTSELKPIQYTRGPEPTHLIVRYRNIFLHRRWFNLVESVWFDTVEKAEENYQRIKDDNYKRIAVIKSVLNTKSNKLRIVDLNLPENMLNP